MEPIGAEPNLPTIARRIGLLARPTYNAAGSTHLRVQRARRPTRSVMYVYFVRGKYYHDS